MKVNIVRQGRILDFDIENRPLSYAGGDFTFSEITAIAAGWCHLGPESIDVKLLGRDDPISMLLWFTRLWNAADIVTGHYILMHDIPIIQGALLEYGLPKLQPQTVSDTKVHLVGGKGVSKSQESLGQILQLEAPKEHMGPQTWREANRLLRLDETERRVKGDVQQHMEMRKRLAAEERLMAPTLWRGGR